MKNKKQELSFDTFINKANGEIDIINIKNFELWVLCSTAVGWVNKFREVTKNGFNPSYKGSLTPYLHHAAEHIANIANSEGGDVETPVLRPMADRLIAAMNEAHDTMSAYPSILRLGDFQKEFWWFYSLWVKGFIDSAEIPTDLHKPIKRDKDRLKHRNKVVFKHGDNRWAYGVTLEDGGRIEVKTFFNNTPMIENHAFAAKPVVNEQEDIVSYVLKNIALNMAVMKAADYATSLIINDKEAVDLSKKIASVLGGHHNSYLLVAKNFKSSVDSIVSSTVHSKDEAAMLVLNRALRGTESEIGQVAVALMSD